MSQDPLASPTRNRPCWCGSGDKYKLCHGKGPRWPPGAPLPDEDPTEGIWISPDTMLSRSALESMMSEMRGAPIWAPSTTPTQRPLVVDAFSARLASVDLTRPTLTFREIALQRIDALDALGLGSEDPERLAIRLAEMSDADQTALADAVFGAGKATLDRLLDQDSGAGQAPTTLWAGGADAGQVAGQTLLWADHYLVDDALAAALLDADSSQAERLAFTVARETQLRPLLEVGVVVLVPEQIAQVLAAEQAYAATEKDLGDSEFADYVTSQLWLEGPSAREVLFVNARDGDDLGQMFFYSHLEKANNDGTFTTTTLADRYDPGRDYQPWIEHVLRQSTAQRVQALNLDLAIADTLGGQRLALTPFEGRLLRRKGAASAGPSPLLWAHVPALPYADPGTLARIAAEDETVAALRRTVRRGMNAAGGAGIAAADEIAEQLKEDADLLRAAIQRDRLWKLASPSGLGVAGLVIGGLVGGPFGVAAAALGAAAGLLPIVADRGANRSNAAYAVLLADRSRRSR